MTHVPTISNPDSLLAEVCSNALQHIENGVMLLDSGQKILFWNQWLVRYSGITAEQAVGKCIDDIFAYPLPSVFLEAVTGACQHGLSRILSHKLHAHLLPLQNPESLSRIFHSIMLQPLPGSVGVVLVQLHDITNAVRRERHLRQAHIAQLEEKQFIDTVLETISALVVVTDAAGSIVNVNHSTELHTGFSEAELIGQPLKMLLGLDSFKHLSNQQSYTGELRSFNCRMTNALDEEIQVRWTVKAVNENDDPLRYLIYTGQDITERERADALLRLEREMLEMAAGNEAADNILNHACLALERQLESCRVAVVQIDTDNKLQVRNAPGLPESFCEQLYELQSERLLRVLEAGLDHGQLQVFTVQPKGDHWQPWLALAKQYKIAGCWLMPIQVNPEVSQNLLAVFPRYKSTPCPHEQMMVQRIGYLTALILERQQQQEEIARLALYDSLTGLANRSLLNEHLQRAILRSVRVPQAFALLFIDLNGFKAVNDNHGHDAGDALLVALSERLINRFRASDCCARMGGDEFVILLDDVQDDSIAFAIANSLLSLIAQPLAWGKHQLQVTASVGIAMYPEDADTAAGLLTRADNAMYHAKADSKINGQGCVMRLNPSDYQS